MHDCSSAGFRRSMGAMTKALHSAMGRAAWGRHAGDARLHRRFRNHQAPLGFVAAIALPDERTQRPSRAARQPRSLETPPGVKRYPAVSPAHGVIAAALKLAEQGGYAIDDIEKIEADFRSFSLSRMQARDEEEAGFCAPYLIAASLVHGAFGPDQIMPAAIDDPRAQIERSHSDSQDAGRGNEVQLRRVGRVLTRGARERASSRLRAEICASGALRSNAASTRSAISSRISISGPRSTA